MGWWYQFWLAFWRACWQAFQEMALARRQAVKEDRDEDSEAVVARFRAAVERLRTEQGSPPGPEGPAQSG